MSPAMLSHFQLLIPVLILLSLSSRPTTQLAAQRHPYRSKEIALFPAAAVEEIDVRFRILATDLPDGDLQLEMSVVDPQPQQQDGGSQKSSTIHNRVALASSCGSTSGSTRHLWMLVDCGSTS